MNKDEDPTNDSVYLAVAAAAHADAPEQRRRFWYIDWWKKWQSTTRSLRGKPVLGPGQDGAKDGDATVLELLVSLKQWKAGLPVEWPRPSARQDMIVWERRIVVHFLETGEYLGPNRHPELVRPDPLWSEERLGVLAADWGTVLRDSKRKSRTRRRKLGDPQVLERRLECLGYVAHSKVPFKLWPSERLELLGPLLFEHLQMDSVEAAWERVQVLAELAEDFQDPAAVVQSLSKSTGNDNPGAFDDRESVKGLIEGLRNIFENALRAVEAAGTSTKG